MQTDVNVKSWSVKWLTQWSNWARASAILTDCPTAAAAATIPTSCFTATATATTTTATAAAAILTALLFRLFYYC